MNTEPQLTPLTDRAIDLLEKRGINAETAVNLGWKTCADRKGDWIAIPFLRDGKPVNHKYRTLSGEKKFSQDKGGEQCFYNIDVLRTVEKQKRENHPLTAVIITEGEMDCAIAIQCGHLAVSVPSGAVEKPTEGDDTAKFKFLEDFPKLCVAILAVDDDAPGRVMRQELALRLGWHRCMWVQYPKGCKDLNEVFVKYGQKGVDKVLKEKSKFMSQGGLFKMSDLPEEPNITGYDPHIEGLEGRLIIRRGDSIVLTGIPGHGKSQLINCIACNMASFYNWNICICSFETRPRAGLQRYLRTYFLEKTEFTREGFLQWTPEDIARADEWINRRFTFIVPDVMSDELTTFKWLLDRLRAAITQHDVSMVIVDPWNEVDHDRPQGMSLTEYTGFAIKEIKRLAQRYMVTPVIVAHPAKLEKNKDGQFDVPNLYNISDSSHWKNKFDIGLIVHRFTGEEANSYGTMVRIEKVREWGVMGNIGDVILKYHPSTGRYTEFPDFIPKKPKTRPKAEKPPAEAPVSQVPAQKSLPYRDD
jgi:twinkle protein